jgi:hypothetical protein
MSGARSWVMFMPLLIAKMAKSEKCARGQTCHGHRGSDSMKGYTKIPFTVPRVWVEDRNHVRL